MHAHCDDHSPHLSLAALLAASAITCLATKDLLLPALLFLLTILSALSSAHVQYHDTPGVSLVGGRGEELSRLSDTASNTVHSCLAWCYFVPTSPPDSCHCLSLRTTPVSYSHEIGRGGRRGGGYLLRAHHWASWRGQRRLGGCVRGRVA